MNHRKLSVDFNKNINFIHGAVRHERAGCGVWHEIYRTPGPPTH